MSRGHRIYIEHLISDEGFDAAETWPHTRFGNDLFGAFDIIALRNYEVYFFQVKFTKAKPSRREVDEFYGRVFAMRIRPWRCGFVWIKSGRGKRTEFIIL